MTRSSRGLRARWRNDAVRYLRKGRNFSSRKIFLKKYLRSRGRFRIVFPRAEAQTGIEKLGCRLMAGQRILVPSMGVRLPPSQPLHLLHMARSSSGLGRRPLKAEITSSNLVRATMSSPGHSESLYIWPVRLAVQDAALSRRRSPVRIWYGLPTFGRAAKAARFRN